MVHSDGKNAIRRHNIALIPTHVLLILKNDITNIVEITIELLIKHLNFNNIPPNILYFFIYYIILSTYDAIIVNLSQAICHSKQILV